MTFRFDGDSLADLYPAFLYVGFDARLLEAGPSALRRVPSLRPGRSLWDVFEVLSPPDIRDMRELAADGGPIQLRTLDGLLTLHGLPVLQADGVLLCTSYAPANITNAETVGLRLTDFSAGDASIVGLMLAGVQEALLNETREAVTQLARARDAAVAAARSQAEFLANMSHEIRTPLMGVVGFSGLLEEVPDLPPDARAYSARIAAASRTLTSVVNNVLDYSAIEAGKVRLTVQPIHPLEVVEEAVRLLDPLAAAKGLFLEVTASSPMPAWVSADRDRLAQIVLNLVGNGIKFTKRGGVTVTVQHVSAPDVLRVEVMDTGPGVARQIDRLFQRFSRLDNSISRAAGGSGLGLAISKGLVELMGGAIGVTSNPGGGSTFWFSLPAPVCAEEAEVDPDKPDHAPPPMGARVLVVDDVPMNREFVRQGLRPLGCTVSTASSGGAAIMRCLDEKFDLIVMDIHMPGTDGLAAIRTIRSPLNPNRGTPIIALSADVTPNNVEACQSAGADDFLPKPVHIKDLAAAAAAWLEHGDHTP